MKQQRNAGAGTAGNDERRHGRRFGRVALSMTLLLLAVGATYALGDEGEGFASPSEGPLPSFIEAAHAASLDLAARLTDLQAAEELPHHDLDRDQAVNLLEGVFEPELQSPAGIFDGLNVERFLSNNAAIVPATINSSSEPVTVGDPNGDAEGEPVLLESTLPLRTEGPSGAEPVDLSLEHAGGEVQSAAPLVEVGIPDELGEGISLPEAGVQIELAEAPAERAPSIIEESVAAYPNVATDTDLAVAPTPTGVETLTTLRSPAAPQTQTFHLSLPQGASLSEHEGGAQVTKGDETLVNIPAPSAIDAAGEAVPVSMSVSGDSLTLSAEPTAQTAWPVLLDPLYETYSWGGGTIGSAGWVSGTSGSHVTPIYSEGFGGGVGRGLWISAPAGTYAPGDGALWVLNVPRLYEDQAKGIQTTSYITHLTLEHLSVRTTTGGASPFVFSGLFDPATGKAAGSAEKGYAVWSYPGNAAGFENWPLAIENGKPTERDKLAQSAYAIAVTTSEAGSIPAERWAYVNYVADEIADEATPKVIKPSAPSTWVNGTAAGPVSAEAIDTGLGVKTVKFEIPGQATVTQTNSCLGTVKTPCPSSWSPSLPTAQYEPAKMATGEDPITITAEDVLGNKAPTSEQAKALVKVDHTAPAIALTGTLTEQGSLGTKRPSYTVTAKSTDGVAGTAPQSGIYEAKVEVDGKVIGSEAPKCATNSCASTINWTLEASKYSAGEHTLKVTATDAVGLISTKELKFSLNPSPASLTLSGTMTEQNNVGTTRPRYVLKESATAAAGVEGKTLTIETKVDGTKVDSGSSTCTVANCPYSREWIMSSSSYQGKEPTVSVTATDGLGNTTTKQIKINVQKDEKGPAISLSGKLVEAPEGWVEQHQYGFEAKATDGGYGVTSLSLKIDGATVASTTGTCTEGACPLTLSKGIDTSSLSGGAHAAVVTATDGAGNAMTESWTVNVDPEGNVSWSEATETLEALEETAPEVEPVATTPEFLGQEIIEAGDDPELSENAGKLESDGTPTETIIEPKTEAITIDGAYAPIEVIPEVQGGSTQIVSGVSAVTPADGSDTIVRPEYNGIYLFTSIREASAPTEYGWHVNIQPNQRLKQTGEEAVEVVYENGTRAFVIAAEPAHDATGVEVATSLRVDGESDIVFTVDHRIPNVVYPVVAGQAYLTGYSTATITENEEKQLEEELPPDPKQPISLAQSEWALTAGPEERTTNVPPVPSGPGKYHFTIYRSLCGPSCEKWKAKLYNATVWVKNGRIAWWEKGTKIFAHIDQATLWEAFFLADTWNCGAPQPDGVAHNDHLTAWGHFSVTTFGPSEKPINEKNFTLFDFIYSNGYQTRHVNWDWSGQAVNHNCPTVAAE